MKNSVIRSNEINNKQQTHLCTAPKLLLRRGEERAAASFSSFLCLSPMLLYSTTLMVMIAEESTKFSEGMRPKWAIVKSEVRMDAAATMNSLTI